MLINSVYVQHMQHDTNAPYVTQWTVAALIGKDFRRCVCITSHDKCHRAHHSNTHVVWRATNHL